MRVPPLDKLKRVAKPSQAKRPLIKPSTTGEDKQLILGRPRPAVIRPPFRLNPAALLVPAIPTIIGKPITDKNNKNKHIKKKIF